MKCKECGGPITDLKRRTMCGPVCELVRRRRAQRQWHLRHPEVNREWMRKKREDAAYAERELKQQRKYRRTKKAERMAQPGYVPRNKLTRGQARKIYRARGTQQSIADRFGISQQAVSRIKNKQQWKFLHEEAR